MNNCGSHAKRELEILFKISENKSEDEQPIIKEFASEIIALVDKFGASGQSGGSAPYVASAISEAIKKLCMFEVISPITGEDNEWNKIENCGDVTYQNKRDSRIFKDEGKQPYFIDAIVWKTQKGFYYSGSALSKSFNRINSANSIKSFPFVPKTFYVDVIENEVSKDNWEFYIKDESQLKEVFEYYDEKVK